MFHKFSHYKKLGVINITPNSFSDPGFNLNRLQLINSISTFLHDSKLILDIGFESTAPMNQAISIELECERFDYFLPVFVDNFKRHKLDIISFDTYKIESFNYFYQEFKKYFKQTKIIFNDVSGIVDDELLKTLSDKRDLFYIYSATRIKKRSDVLFHMKDFIESGDIVNEVKSQFLNVEKVFVQNKINDSLILDLGLGFSKTIDENWQLLDQLESVIKNVQHPILFGLSKKSFLYKKIDSQNPKEDSELIHFYLIKEIEMLSRKLKKQAIFRVHNPYIL